VDAAAGEASVGVDAQASWDVVTALAALDPLFELNVSFLEQPVSRNSPDHFAEITARSAVPTMAHESALDPESALANARRRIARIWSLTPASHGGLLATLDVLAVARLARIPARSAARSNLESPLPSSGMWLPRSTRSFTALWGRTSPDRCTTKTMWLHRDS
jgi:L-alanine-DL-glutamate epimerase-like enolase superfamily enzyme